MLWARACAGTSPFSALSSHLIARYSLLFSRMVKSFKSRLYNSYLELSVLSSDTIAYVIEELRGYGPLGLGVLAFISNLVPGFPAVYLSLLASYAVIVRGFVESLVVIVSVGVGAGLGKFTLFLLSKSLGSRIGVIRRRREALKLLRTRRGGLALTVFLFAALPLPDDLLYIPLGVAGFSTPVFLVSVIAGKMAMAAIVFLMGTPARWLIEATVPRMGELTLAKVTALTIVTLVPAIAITYVILSVDWFKVYRAYAEMGEREAAKTLAKEIADAVTLKQSRGRIARAHH